MRMSSAMRRRSHRPAEASSQPQFQRGHEAQLGVAEPHLRQEHADAFARELAIQEYALLGRGLRGLAARAIGRVVAVQFLALRRRWIVPHSGQMLKPGRFISAPAIVIGDASGVCSPKFTSRKVTRSATKPNGTPACRSRRPCARSRAGCHQRLAHVEPRCRSSESSAMRLSRSSVRARRPS